MNLSKQKNKGITLIALVITIIVLLIIVGIAINAITDDDIIEKANQSALEQMRAALEENLNMDFANKHAETKGESVPFLDFMKEVHENKRYNVKFSGDNSFVIYNKHVFQAIYENNKIKVIYIGSESEVEWRK